MIVSLGRGVPMGCYRIPALLLPVQSPGATECTFPTNIANYSIDPILRVPVNEQTSEWHVSRRGMGHFNQATAQPSSECPIPLGYQTTK